MTDTRTPTDAAPEVRHEVTDGTGVITLDRPRAINALSVAMVDELLAVLQAWAVDPAVAAVELRGAGERGFCSGADVRAIRQLVLDEPAAAVRFFEVEYALDALIASYPKPVTSQLHGISMGGGLGLALHATTVRADADLQLAMPETGIGLFPDVGVTWQLAKAPGEIGAWLAMTGTTIDAAGARYAGLVHEVPDEVDPGASELDADRAWIDACFTGDDSVAIVRALENHDEPRARQCAELLRGRSPWSVAVALEAVRRAASMADVYQVLAQDAVLARNFVADSDFVEGVRAQLVDKDRQPHWRHARLEDVPRELVLGMFQA